MNFLARRCVLPGMQNELSEDPRFPLRRGSKPSLPLLPTVEVRSDSRSDAASQGAPETPAVRRDAYRRLIETEEAFLLRAASRLCRHSLEDAQDLVQDTLVRGYVAFLDKRFAEGTNVRAWLMRILMNLFLNAKRREKWRSNADLTSLIQNGLAGHPHLMASPQDRPDTALWMRTLDEPLEKALATLSEELRVCVFLVDIEEWTYAEAARMLTIPLGTVRSRLWKARRLLSAQLVSYARTHRKTECKGPNEDDG